MHFTVPIEMLAMLSTQKSIYTPKARKRKRSLYNVLPVDIHPVRLLPYINAYPPVLMPPRQEAYLKYTQETLL